MGVTISLRVLTTPFFFAGSKKGCFRPCGEPLLKRDIPHLGDGQAGELKATFAKWLFAAVAFGIRIAASKTGGQKIPQITEQK
jgi:hypothetical protein